MTKKRNVPYDLEGPMDYCFTRMTAFNLAQAMVGDVRITPTVEQINIAARILERTGDLYRMVAGFNIDEWEKQHG